ncbi:MAG: hypothetical protein PHR43_02060 [Dehalococcoidales bacterium]|nr:hypothetical protein [Dehalococcoidales bacterium]
MIRKLIDRFGKLVTASFFVMAIGFIAFLLTPLLYGMWGIDSDLPGMVLVCIGLAICITGMIRRKKPHGWKLAIWVILAVVLLLPALQLIVSLIYYLMTGEPLGS